MTNRLPARTAAVTLHDYRVLAGFRRSLRQFLHFSEEAARDAGLTPAQHQLLLAIKGFDPDEDGAASGTTPAAQAPSVGEAADWLQLRHHSAVELVDRAVAAGLITRETDPGDLRRQLLHLTRQGEDKLAALSALHRDELQRFRAQVLVELDDLS